jgi:hypothetical protein
VSLTKALTGAAVLCNTGRVCQADFCGLSSPASDRGGSDALGGAGLGDGGGGGGHDPDGGPGDGSALVAPLGGTFRSIRAGKGST